MKRCAYLLYGDHASGIINSQAVDVAKYLDSIPEVSCKLIAFLPYPFALKTHKDLEKFYGQSLAKTRALPQRLWPLFLKWESLRLAWKVRQGKIETIICRGAFATLIALETRNKFCKTLRVCYDGRGAMAAEHEEYGVYPHYLESFMYMCENRSVIESDIRISVTENLANYWKDRYGYQSKYHEIIPTTLDSSKSSIIDLELYYKNRTQKRSELDLTNEEIILIYSGSSSGWQSFDLMINMVDKCLCMCNNYSILFLTDKNKLITALKEKHPNKIFHFKVEQDEVHGWLSAADYGLLIREKSITNLCASPTKYAEYLRAGLRVISNGNTGCMASKPEFDFNLIIADLNSLNTLKKSSSHELREIINSSEYYFGKKQYLESYKKIITK